MINYRVTTNLEKSGNSKVVREKSRKTEISVMTKYDLETLSVDSVMQENLLAAGAPPRTLPGELTVLPYPLAGGTGWLQLAPT